MGSFYDFDGRTDVVSTRIEYTGTYIDSRTCRVTLKLYAARTDWPGASNCTYTATTYGPTWTEDYSLPIGTTTAVFSDHQELHILTRTFDVTVDDNGRADVNMYFSVTATSSSSYTVSATVTSLQFEAPPTKYHLYVMTGNSITVSVYRQYSKHGKTGYLLNGEILYASDELVINYTANEGYYVSSFTVNKSMVGDGAVYVVQGDVEIEATTPLYYFYLDIVAGDGVTVTVNRTSTKSTAGTGRLNNGDYVYYFDELTVSYSVATGYEISVCTLNGNPFTSGSKITVTRGIEVIVSSGALGLVYIGGETYQVYIGNGSGWDMHAPYIGEGPTTGFVLCS